MLTRPGAGLSGLISHSCLAKYICISLLRREVLKSDINMQAVSCYVAANSYESIFHTCISIEVIGVGKRCDTVTEPNLSPAITLSSPVPYATFHQLEISIRVAFVSFIGLKFLVPFFATSFFLLVYQRPAQ